MFGDEVAGDRRTEGAGAAGDQDGAVRPPGRGRLGVSGGGGHAGQPGQQESAVPDGGLRFVGGEERGQQLGCDLLGVGVHEHDPARVLRLRRVDQPPDGRRTGTEPVPFGRVHRPLGDDHQPGVREAFVGQPALEQRQGGGGLLVEPGEGAGVLGGVQTGEQKRYGRPVTDGLPDGGQVLGTEPPPHRSPAPPRPPAGRERAARTASR